MMRRAAASRTHKHYRFTGLPLWQAGFWYALGMSIDRRVQVPHASLMAGTRWLKAGGNVLLPCVHTDIYKGTLYMYIYAG